MEKVSIIVPVYNVESYLRRCVKSLLDQTYSNVEILLIDDGSTDASGDLCDRLAEQDSRILTIHQTNQGVSAARNCGLDSLSGDWVCFCDGDDWYDLGFVEKMLACAENTGADYLICDYYIAQNNGTLLCPNSTKILNTGCDPRLVVACGAPYSCVHMIKRKLFKKSNVRYPEHCKRSEELPVIPVLATYAEKIGIVKEPLYYYFQRNDGSSASNSPQTDEEFFKPFCLLKQAIGSGYEKELEYLIIYALFYGRILEMCKKGLDRAEIKDKLREYKKKYPRYGKNPYISQSGLFKKCFIKFEEWNWIFGLRILAKIHSKVAH